MTFPLWLHPASRIQSLGDPLLNSYIIGWDRYALLHQLYEFFQANVFWPNADALAYGEHLLSPAILALPFSLFTRSAPALHNVSLVEAYFLCALAAHALAFFYFRSILAATISGLTYGFAAYRISQVGHLQLVHGEFLPLMVLAFELCLRSERRAWRWLLFAAAAGQWLASWYWAVFSFWCLAPYFAFRVWQNWGRTPPSRIAWAILPLALAVLCVVPVAIPYMSLKTRNLLYHPKEASAGLSAEFSDYARPPARALLYRPIKRDRKPGFSERELFPGLAVSLGFVAAIVLVFRKRRTPIGEQESEFSARLWIGITLLLLLFSFGSSAQIGGEKGGAIPLPYALVERFFPFAGNMRVPARWLLPASLGFSMLMGYSWSELFNSRRGAAIRTLGRAASFLLLAECLTTPVPYVKIESAAPPVYAWLDQQPFPSPVLELPILPDGDNRAMLHATWHRQPIVNGSNGYMPPGQMTLLRTLANFPDRESLAKLTEIRVRYVVIDTAEEKNDVANYAARLTQALNALGSGANVKGMGRHLVVDLKGAH